MPRRVVLCRAALALVDRATEGELWATLQTQLARSLQEDPRAERAATSSHTQP